MGFVCIGQIPGCVFLKDFAGAQLLKITQHRSTHILLRGLRSRELNLFITGNGKNVKQAKKLMV